MQAQSVDTQNLPEAGGNGTRITAESRGKRRSDAQKTAAAARKGKNLQRGGAALAEIIFPPRVCG